jgi:elongation factor G
MRPQRCRPLQGAARRPSHARHFSSESAPVVHRCLHQVLAQIKDKLRLSCAFVTLPIGLEDKLSGLVDIVHMRAIYFDGTSVTFVPHYFSHALLGDTGSNVRYDDIPPDMADAAKAARRALVESVGEVDEEMVTNPFVTTEFLSYCVYRATSSCRRVTLLTRSSRRRYVARRSRLRLCRC